MSSLNQDLFFLLALSVENSKINHLAIDSWQKVLAEARTHFIYPLIIENGLHNGRNGHILEFADEGSSQLEARLLHKGLTTHRVSTEGMLNNLQEEAEYSLVVSHNQLEHLGTIEQVESVMDALADKALYGMVHQVHAVNNLGYYWDKTHSVHLTTAEWESHFRYWAEKHKAEGWDYLGHHQGAPGRPENHVLERNGSLPYYKHYEKKALRQFIGELTLANGITTARIPLLLASFALTKNNPYLLAGLIGVVHGLDGLDGKAAREFGSSRYGPFLDIATDHFIELYTAFEYAYELEAIPKSVPWILAARDLSVDFLRFYNGITKSFEDDTHPHKAFGSESVNGRNARILYGARKVLGDMVIPVIPSLGLALSTVHVVESLARAEPVLNSPRAREITNAILNKIQMSKSRN